MTHNVSKKNARKPRKTHKSRALRKGYKPLTSRDGNLITQDILKSVHVFTHPVPQKLATLPSKFLRDHMASLHLSAEVWLEIYANYLEHRHEPYFSQDVLHKIETITFEYADMFANAKKELAHRKVKLCPSHQWIVLSTRGVSYRRLVAELSESVEWDDHAEREVQSYREYKARESSRLVSSMTEAFVDLYR